MRRSLKSWLILGLLLGTMAYALAEEITLVTYYPSPRGRYNELMVNTLTITPPGNLDLQGSLAVGPGVDPGAAGQVFIDGQVGIGTGASAIPAGTLLQVAGGKVELLNADVFMELDHGLWFDRNQQAGLLSRSGTGNLNIVTGGTDTVKVTPTGNVGIGTAGDPASKLHIAGTASNLFQLQLGTDRFHLQKSAVIPGRWNFTLVPNAPGTSNLYLSDWTNNPASFDLLVQGDVGIGTPAPTAALDVAGNARVAGTLTLNTSSPIKLEYQNCQWIDGGQANRPTRSRSCPRQGRGFEERNDRPSLLQRKSPPLLIAPNQYPPHPRNRLCHFRRHYRRIG